MPRQMTQRANRRCPTASKRTGNRHQRAGGHGPSGLAFLMTIAICGTRLRQSDAEGVALTQALDNRPMTDDDLPPERLASIFAHFVQQVAYSAAAQTSPLLDKIQEIGRASC